ncbi:MAG: hypothetical protein IPL59_01080 [Candidatus Competibacteraceae bacterium]|uniref:hypothetical protein n=1 Tax=Candidatus Contendibacter odensensis TaxID=1400860 RepID=UPI0004AF9FAE|nr:hypothetical protein [Candidatus Contendobacter odensis]MBK8533814.1 hypothetical protein [Candidatus Competibacteraceae bacterium]MBK8751332.1 hypothetical protein [Candidatus Competibacteraceae bacterium]
MDHPHSQMGKGKTECLHYSRAPERIIGIRRWAMDCAVITPSWAWLILEAISRVESVQAISPLPFQSEPYEYVLPLFFDDCRRRFVGRLRLDERTGAR